MDKIEIRNLEIFANHGVFPEENVLGQKFVVSATLYTDTRKAGLSDELTASIHYGEVSHMTQNSPKSIPTSFWRLSLKTSVRCCSMNFLYLKRSLARRKAMGSCRTSTGYGRCRDHQKLAYRLRCFWLQSGRQKEISG